MAYAKPKLEHLKKCYSQFGARIFELWRGFGEGAGLNNPVTEPKRSQNSKRPFSLSILPNGYNIFENALMHFFQGKVSNRYSLNCASISTLYKSCWRLAQSELRPRSKRIKEWSQLSDLANFPRGYVSNMPDFIGNSS
jgi:hypothetical protein